MVPCGIICSYGLVTLLATSFVQCVKIHEYMTDDEIANIFHAVRHNMPEYDVVTIRHNLYKRSSSNLRLQFNAFGKEIDAYLQPSDVVLAGENTPVWLASTKPNGTVEYKKMRGDIIGTLVTTFVGLSGLSAIRALKPEGEKVSFRGYLNSLKVVPLPRNVTKYVRSKRELKSSKASRTLLDTHYHVIIKSTRSTNENDKLTLLERSIQETRVLDETNYSKSKRSIKDIILPILVNTDLAPSNTVQNDDFPYCDEIIYQLAFWNAVDLLFRPFVNPKVRIRIAGIIIGLDRGVTPYMKYRNGDVIHLPVLITHVFDYWHAMTEHPDFPLKAYNVIATITDNDLTHLKDGVEERIVGLARPSSVCLGPWLSNRMHTSNIIISDKGGFSGVGVATYLLGQVLGLPNDGQTGDECDDSYLYIMRRVNVLGPKNHEWSPCSLRRLSSLFTGFGARCVDPPDYDIHPPGTAVQRILPGDIATTHEQCQGREFDWACPTSSEICTNMACYYTGWKGFKWGWWCMDAGPAAEGTTCSPGHRCFQRRCQCVSEECASKKK